MILFLRFITLTMAFAIVIFGCTKKGYDRKDSIIIAIPQLPKTLDPRFTTDATGERMSALLFSSLVHIGPGLKVVGDAAEKWEYKNKTYTFYLHKGLKFSDGSPLTKDDILFTFQEYSKPTSPFKASLDLIENVDADFSQNTPTVTLKLKSFSAVLLTDLALIRFLPKKIVEQYGNDFGDHLVGSGAFALESKNLDEIVLKARDDHPVYHPHIRYAVFKIIQDDSTRFLNVFKGSVDIIQSDLPVNKISYIEKENKYQIFKHVGPSMNYILLNLKDPLFKNKDFRWALSHAIDRESIIKYKLESYAMSATSLLPPNNPFYDAELKPVVFEPAEAKSIVNKLGFAHKKLILKTSNNPGVVDVARVIASQLSDAGLDVKIQSYEWGTFYGDIKNGNYQMALMRWVGLVDPDIYRLAFDSKEFPPGRNRSFYSNKNLDPLLDQGQAIEDFDRRGKLYNKIQKVIFDEQIIIPLWYNILIDLVHKRVSGYRAPDNGDLSPLYDITVER